MVKVKYNENLAKEIENGGLLEDYQLENEKVPESKIPENSINKSSISQKEENCKPNFFKMFENTEYFTKNNCTYHLTYTADGKPKSKRLCNFVVWIDKEITVDDGLETHKIFILKGNHANGYTIPCISVAEKDFCDMSWVIKSLGSRGIVESGQRVKDLLRHCIQTISKDVKLDTIFGFTGWKKYQGKWLYLHCGGAVGKENIKVALEGRLEKYCLPDKTEGLDNKLQDVFDTIENVASKHITLPLLALTFLSPLNEFLRQAGHEPDFIYFLLAKTGCGKSTLTALFLSFFGNFSSTSLPFSFQDTANSIMLKTFMTKDILACADDFKPSSHAEIARMTDTAQTLARAIGERTGRKRLKSDATPMKESYPRCNLLMSGEMLPNVGESGVARMIISEIKRKDIDFDFMTKAQKNARNNVYSGIMRGYIEWLQVAFLDNNEELFIEVLRSDFNKSRNFWQDKLKGSVHARIPTTLAFLQIGYNYFLEFCKAKNVLNKDLAEEKSNLLTETLYDMAKIHADFSLEDKPTFKFISTLKELIVSEKVTILPEGKYGESISSYKPLIGYEGRDFYYCIPSVVYNEVFKFCSTQGDVFPLSKNRLLKHLKEEGFIKTEGKENTLLKRIAGSKPMRVICFYKDRFDNFESLFETNVTSVTNATDSS